MGRPCRGCGGRAPPEKGLAGCECVCARASLLPCTRAPDGVVHAECVHESCGGVHGFMYGMCVCICVMWQQDGVGCVCTQIHRTCFSLPAHLCTIDGALPCLHVYGVADDKANIVTCMHLPLQLCVFALYRSRQVG